MRPVLIKTIQNVTGEQTRVCQNSITIPRALVPAVATTFRFNTGAAVLYVMFNALRHFPDQKITDYFTKKIFHV